MTQDQINTATKDQLTAHADDLRETLADPNTDQLLYLGSKNELEAVENQIFFLDLDEFWAPFCN